MSEPNEEDFGLVADILGNAQKFACAVYVATYREECERAERERVLDAIARVTRWTLTTGVRIGLQPEQKIIDSDELDELITKLRAGRD